MSLSAKACAAAFGLVLAAGAAPAQAAYLYEGSLGIGGGSGGEFSFTLADLGVPQFTVEGADLDACAFAFNSQAGTCRKIVFYAQNAPYPQGPGLNVIVDISPASR